MQSEQADPCPENPGQGDMKHLQHTVMRLFSNPAHPGIQNSCPWSG